MEDPQAESDIAPDAIHADRAYGGHRSPEPLLLSWKAAVAPSLPLSMQPGRPAVSSRRHGALLLSCTRASVTELSDQTLAADDTQCASRVGGAD